VKEVRDAGTREAEPLGELIVIEAEAIDVVLEAMRLLDRVEIGALDVLDEGGLEGLLVVEIADAVGTALSPASLAARRRRSPATSW